ncbi:MAG: HK97 family phage prohead protease [Propionibacteriales bacterium]|nr:HK97 family phage prohead protease [Propionibacteriales bacterium]
MELRTAAELRAVPGRRLAGYAAVFDSPARIANFTETIRPGAFRKALANPNADCLALVDHDNSRLLARQRSRTLRLHEDSKGLEFELDLPPTGLGNDVLAMVERGDMGGCSIGFRCIQDVWPSADVRHLVTLDLAELSLIHAHPAYDGTSIFARSRPPARLIGTPAMHARLRLAAVL